ncbi:hypothetical protein D3C84_1004160 [compost metagenome]
MLCSFEYGGVRDNSNYQESKHNRAMQRMLSPPLRYGFVAGDGACGAQQCLYALQLLPQRAERIHARAWTTIKSGT